MFGVRDTVTTFKLFCFTENNVSLTPLLISVHKQKLKSLVTFWKTGRWCPRSQNWKQTIIDLCIGDPTYILVILWNVISWSPSPVSFGIPRCCFSLILNQGCIGCTCEVLPRNISQDAFCAGIKMSNMTAEESSHVFKSHDITVMNYVNTSESWGTFTITQNN